MTRSQFNEVLLKSNEICAFEDIFGYNRIVTHYDKNKDRTTLYCIHYEDRGDGYGYHSETKEYDKGYYRCLLNPFEECREVCTMQFIKKGKEYNDG